MALELERSGKAFRVRRVVCAVECGRAINPNLIRANIEGGIGFALTNTLKSEITFKAGVVQQSNFHDYPLLQLAEMPKIDVVIVPSDRPRRAAARCRSARWRPPWRTRCTRRPRPGAGRCR